MEKNQTCHFFVHCCSVKVKYMYMYANFFFYHVIVVQKNVFIYLCCSVVSLFVKCLDMIHNLKLTKRRMKNWPITLSLVIDITFTVILKAGEQFQINET